MPISLQIGVIPPIILGIDPTVKPEISGDFYKLMSYMNYKKDKVEDTYIFLGEKKKKKKIIRFDKKENPFKKLLSLNLNK